MEPETQVEEKMPVLAPDEPISKSKTLKNNVWIFVEPETRKVYSIVADGPFGAFEYDPAAAKYVKLGDVDQERIYNYFNNYVKYMVDWNNPNAFDDDNKSLVLKMFSDGTLDESWLKDNTKYAGDVLTSEE